MTETVESYLKETEAVLGALVRQADQVEQIAALVVQTLKSGGKILIFGNGGSAADSQHFAAELVGRFEKERKGLPAIALTVDTSSLTALANDYSYDRVFARQVDSLARPGDAVIGLSTSGNSASVLQGIEAAKKIGAKTIGFSGEAGGKLKGLVDRCLCVPSKRTSHIQEGHISAIHAICSRIDQLIG